MCKLNPHHHPEQGAFDFNTQHSLKGLKKKKKRTLAKAMKLTASDLSKTASIHGANFLLYNLFPLWTLHSSLSSVLDAEVVQQGHVRNTAMIIRKLFF